MAMPPAHFVWYELMTSNSQRAAAYYRSVIGWHGKDAGMPDHSYTILSAGAADVAGLMPLPAQARAAGARPGWIGYLGVADVDAASSRIQREGGTVHRAPADIPGVGRFAIVADPQRAVFALFHGIDETPSATPATDQPGTIGWHELHAVDGASAFDFYARHFGWTQEEALDMGALGVYQLFAANGTTIGGMMTKTAETPAPFWLYYFNVPAIDAAVTLATEGGGQVIMGPHQVPGGSWIVQCLDPQGALFAMLSTKR